MEKLTEIGVGDREACRAIEDEPAQVLAALALIGRVVDDLHFQLDPGLGELRLNDLHEGLLRRDVGDDRLDGDAVLVAGLGQQGLGLGEVEAIADGAILAEIAGRDDGAALGTDILADEAHEIVDIDGGGDGAAHADVVERRLAAVDVQQTVFAGLEDLDIEAGAPAGGVDPALLALGVEQVELAGGEGELARAVGGDGAHHDRVDLGLAAEIIGVGGELHILLGHLLDEGEGPGADRLGAIAVAELLAGLAADDVAAMVVGDTAEEIDVRVFQGDADGEVVELLDLVDRREVRGEGRALRIAGALQGIDDVVGSERAPAAMEFDALAQMEGPDLAVRRGFPALGEIGFQVFGIGAAGLEADEPVVEPADQRLVVGRAGAMGVEGRDIAGAGADPEDRFLGSGLSLQAGNQHQARKPGGMHLHRLIPSLLVGAIVGTVSPVCPSRNRG